MVVRITMDNIVYGSLATGRGKTMWSRRNNCLERLLSLMIICVAATIIKGHGGISMALAQNSLEGTTYKYEGRKYFLTQAIAYFEYHTYFKSFVN